MQQYQVSELTEIIKNLFDSSFKGNIMVYGEVTEFFKSSSGHLYFSLKDDKSKLRCIFFKQLIRAETYIPKNGDKVGAVGELRLYEPDGSYSLSVRKVVYSAEGDFWRKFEETKNKLDALGYFDKSSKKPIPKYPKRIALLTSETGAAIKDFIITSKNAGCFYDIDVWPIPVQGKDAASQIVKTITLAGKRTDLYDALALTRGGGSLEDLAVFNEETVATALKKSNVPTISAIGHEQDVTICDFVADERVATPTAAAERLSRIPKESKLKVNALNDRLITLLRWRRESATLIFDKLYAKLQAPSAFALVNNARLQLQKTQIGLTMGLRSFAANQRMRFERINSSIASHSPQQNISAFLKGVVYLQSELVKYVRLALSKETHKLELLTQRLILIDPERVFELGYALVTHSGNAVASVLDIHINDALEIKIKDGRIDAFVTGRKVFDN